MLAPLQAPSPWILVRRYGPLVLVAAALLTFGLLAEEVVEGDTLGFDRWGLLLFRTPGTPEVPLGPLWLQEAVRDLTSLGSVSILVIITVATVMQLLLSGRLRTGLYVAGAVVSGSVISTVLKILFDRPRPDMPGAPHVFTASFPSGHATLSAVVFLTLAAVLAATTSERRLQAFYVALGIVLTVVVGISRIYIGVHYPTDVAAGWLIGTSWAILCWAGADALARHRPLKSAPTPPRA
jgi:undecaprenyl-diphosphatase